MDDDAMWFETAFVTGVTNAHATLAESMMLPLTYAANGGDRRSIVPLLSDDEIDAGVLTLFEEIKAYYGSDKVPAIYRYLAGEPGYVRDTWNAMCGAFADRTLTRKFKECIAVAVSVAARSPYSIDLHRTQAKRLGVSDKGVMEAIQVAQLFNTYTKIADVLQLEPDFPVIE